MAPSSSSVSSSKSSSTAGLSGKLKSLSPFKESMDINCIGATGRAGAATDCLDIPKRMACCSSALLDLLELGWRDAGLEM
eukprot:scaffold178360_cov42-Prasinocladus_malaysianus.AAC.1